MNQHGYMIMEINDGWENHHGTRKNILIVQANRINYDGYYHSYEPYIGDDTELFFFLDQDGIYERLQQIAERREKWYPIEEDYDDTLSRSIDHPSSDRQLIHRHVSLRGGSYEWI